MNNHTGPVVNQVKMMFLQLKPKTFIFMDTVPYWWGQYGCSSPSTKGLRGTDSVTRMGEILQIWFVFEFLLIFTVQIQLIDSID